MAARAPDKNDTVAGTHPDGSTDEFEGVHTMGAQQIEWFKAGSALNIIRARTA